MAIQRTFQKIPEDKLSESDHQHFLVNLGWSTAIVWQDVLRSRRVLIVSEAGAGKTYECQMQSKLLWSKGEPAFYLELASLAACSDLRSLLEDKEEARLDEWLASQSEVATFFLDSIDELKLSLGSFKEALMRLSKGIAGQLGRARIVITTRPVPFDEQLIRRLLPLPDPQELEANGESFARIAMGQHSNEQKSDGREKVPEWRTVALMPLSDAQIEEFSHDQGVSDSASLLADLKRRNAEEFARRPQDLIELCADWRDFKRIRTHKEQVAGNIRIKLKPREDRREPAELPVEKAIEGASRLALAMMVTRRFTVRHSAEADGGMGLLRRFTWRSHRDGDGGQCAKIKFVQAPANRPRPMMAGAPSDKRVTQQFVDQPTSAPDWPSSRRAIQINGIQSTQRRRLALSFVRKRLAFSAPKRQASRGRTGQLKREHKRNC